MKRTIILRLTFLNILFLGQFAWCGNKNQNALLEQVKDCPICLDDINDRKSITIPCKHIFHKDCLDGWSQSEICAKNQVTTCPYCRASFVTKTKLSICRAPFATKKEPSIMELIFGFFSCCTNRRD